MTDLSFDPRDPYFAVPGSSGLRWAVQVFTTDNGYGLDPARVQIDRPDPGLLVLRATRYARLGQQATAAEGEVAVRVQERDGRLEFAITAEHPELVKSVKLLLRGLDPAALDEGWWSPTSPAGTRERNRFQWTYPGQQWATPWAAAGSAVTVSVRDPEVRAKVLHVHRPVWAGEPIVELVHADAAHARRRRCEVPPILVGTTGDTDGGLADHLSFLERAHGLRRWEDRTDVPAWLHDTALVVSLHGQHWTGHVFNTFETMRRTLRFVTEHLDGRQVLAYLPGWEGRYYHSYPRYRPGAALGGEAGFAALAAEARELGVRLMPMFGANGVNVTQYPSWQQAAIRNDTDRYIDMVNRPDWDGDRFGEGDQVFLNPGEPTFREFLADQITAVVRDFGVDAVFLDTASFWFNDGRHPIHLGYRELVECLRGRHPDLLLASEGWWDAMLALFPLAQQWLDADRDLTAPQLLTRYARTTGHLAEGTPGSGSTGVHEQGFRTRPPDRRFPGHLPVVSLVESTMDDNRAEVARICRWAGEQHAAAAPSPADLA